MRIRPWPLDDRLGQRIGPPDQPPRPLIEEGLFARRFSASEVAASRDDENEGQHTEDEKIDLPR